MEIDQQTDMSEKMKALEAARLQIEKQYGQGSLMKLGTRTDASGLEVIPSGSILLDEPFPYSTDSHIKDMVILGNTSFILLM